jgi:hypothetical protein
MPSSLIHRESADKSGEDGFTGFVVEPGLMSTLREVFMEVPRSCCEGESEDPHLQ